ncbi:hypothetical protein [Euzebya tangerina]|uniref:hypothetical protein n=1 Tax=Euzebya tangerina TaxID=591198 RepID=UPI0013C320D9|nr:hypothetical protein [Euzebya tangerina]
MSGNSSPGGAGPVGGLLFLGVLLLVGWVVITTVVGIIKWLIGAAILLAVVSLAVKVLSRS